MSDVTQILSAIEQGDPHAAELLDWTGRQVHEGKSGVIPDHLAPILTRLRIRTERWFDLIEHFDDWFRNFAGHVDELRQVAARSGKRRCHRSQSTFRR
jgi:hypothetical protein